MPIPDDQRELLLKEYDHLTTSLHANEGSGEGRVNLLLAVTAGIGAAFGLAQDNPLIRTSGGFNAPLFAAAAFVLAIGYLTLLRLVQRNRVTDGYIRKLGLIRSRFLADDPGLAPWLPFPADPDAPGRTLALREIVLPRKVGLVQIVAAVDALAAGALLVSLAPLAMAVTDARAGVILAAGAGAAWAAQLLHVRRLYAAGPVDQRATAGPRRTG